MIDIRGCLERLARIRPVFTSESDFQMELAWMLKQLYPNDFVICEYVPLFAPQMHIDILVVKDGRWIPIELKYKTKGCTKIHQGIVYSLKNHGARDINSYLYLKDIERMEFIRDNSPDFEEGYAILITNDPSYLTSPLKDDCVYKEFTFAMGEKIKSGKHSWSDQAGYGTMRGHEDPIVLTEEYAVNWVDYSQLDSSKSGHFWALVNKVSKKEE